MGQQPGPVGQGYILDAHPLVFPEGQVFGIVRPVLHPVDIVPGDGADGPDGDSRKESPSGSVHPPLAVLLEVDIFNVAEAIDVAAHVHNEAVPFFRIDSHSPSEDLVILGYGTGREAKDDHVDFRVIESGREHANIYDDAGLPSPEFRNDFGPFLRRGLAADGLCTFVAVCKDGCLLNGRDEDKTVPSFPVVV